jgi:hypothetical protein
MPKTPASEVNPRRLTPTRLCKLLNGTSLGSVIDVRKLHRHRQKPDGKFADGKHIDLIRYTAWLVDYHQHQTSETWADVKERARKRAADIATAGRDIGKIPDVVNPVRRDRAVGDFRYFCEAYFPKTFALKWSKDHLRVIAAIERTVIHGGQQAIAMPRGNGKTSLCEAACVWSVVTGKRHFVAVVAASEPLAVNVLESIKTEFESNAELAADFPEVCFPIQKLEGINNRASGQLCKGERTHIAWTRDEIVLPTVAGSAGSGAIIKTAGLTGAVRGMKHKRRDGVTDRPELVLIDDPQTAASARSAPQCIERARIIGGDVLGMAGPDVRIAALMPCTVVRPGDLADTFLDHDKHPEWNGERCPLVYEWPKRSDLWEEYESILQSAAGNGDERHRTATAFYAENRDAMDAGAVVAWPERYYLATQISALQYAFDWKIRDAEAFAAEAQQAPLTDDRFASQLEAADITSKITNRDRGIVPADATKLTAFIDIQQAGLFYTVIAWLPDFSGSVIDYGTWPDQRTGYFRRSEMKRTMLDNVPGATSMPAAIYGALGTLVDLLAGKEWTREAGGIKTLDRLLIDANWNVSTNTVYQFCRESVYKNILTPSHGKFVGPQNVPFSEHAITNTDQIGFEWKLITNTAKRAIPYCLIDTNFWKTFMAERWATPMGGAGSLTLFGSRPVVHQMFGDHQTAEFRTPTMGRGRRVEVWDLKPGRPDNDYLDCVVGCGVGASIEGITLAGTQARDDRASGAAQWSAFLGSGKTRRA